MARLLSFDAFSKTVEDARIKTASGGIVSIISIIIIIWLALSEWVGYRRIEYRPELVVDKARGDRLNININITFPHMPCDLLTMDIMDVSGEIQQAISHGIKKTRLDDDGNVISWSDLSFEQQGKEETVEDSAIAKRDDPDYCGSCWGAAPAGSNKCCNTCEDVKLAYAAIGWAFHDGKGIEQCEQERYGEKLEAAKNEGCNIAGHVDVNKVPGNFHFAPGASFTLDQSHSHDLSVFYRKDLPYNLGHVINHLSFGKQITATGDELESTGNPLDSTFKEAPIKEMNYMYFIKVVATRFERLNGDVIETNQYSVTSHERGLSGGRDDDHPHTLHSRGGVPGVYFSYDISAMKVINRELRAKSFGEFLTGVCSVIGGVLTVGAIIDRGMWQVNKALLSKKDK